MQRDDEKAKIHLELYMAMDVKDSKSDFLKYINSTGRLEKMWAHC